MHKKLVLAVLMLVVAAALVAIRLRSRPAAESGTSPADVVSSGAESFPGGSAPTADQTKPVASQAALPTPIAPATQAADPEFQGWLQKQAASIDNPKVNPAAVEAEMNQRVNRLTQVQKRQLLQNVRSPSTPPSEKILSTYLLVEAGPQALQELKELITAPPSDTSRHEAHTQGEMDSVREKTLKIMALDGLASRAQNDPEARATLAKAMEEAQDPYVKRYAQEQLNRLSRQ